MRPCHRPQVRDCHEPQTLSFQSRVVDGSASIRMKELWDLRDEKKPRVALSRSAIVRAAIEVADAEGLEAISMQRIAGELGFTKMSLYRHVANKDELIGLMVDNAVGDPPDVSAIPGDWRARLEEVVRRLTAIWQ